MFGPSFIRSISFERIFWWSSCGIWSIVVIINRRPFINISSSLELIRSVIIYTPFFWMNVFLISSEILDIFGPESSLSLPLGTAWVMILHIFTIDMMASDVKRDPFSLDLEAMEVNGSTRSLNSSALSSSSSSPFSSILNAPKYLIILRQQAIFNISRSLFSKMPTKNFG